MRLFIAIDIPDEIKNKLELVSKKLGSFGARSVKSDKMHITILFIGAVEENSIAAIKKALESIDANKFECRIEGIRTFSSDARVVFAEIKSGEEELKRINHLLVAHLAKNNIKLEARAYSPHITLARSTFKTDVAAVTKFIEDSGFEFGSFIVDEIKLKDSIESKDGHIYKDLSMKPLA